MTQTKRLLVLLIPSFFLLFSPPVSASGRPTVKIGLKENSPPVFVDANGQPAGLDINLLNQFAAQETRHPEPVVSPSRSGLLALAEETHLSTIKNDPNSIYFQSRRTRLDKEQKFFFSEWLKWSLIAAAAMLTWLGLLVLILHRQVNARTAELVAANAQLRLEIKEHQQIEQALRENEERLSLAISGTSGALWDILIDPEAGFDEITDEVYMSPEEKKLLGYSEREPIPASRKIWESHVLPEDQVERTKRQRDHFEGRTKYLDHEYRIRSEDGRLRWIHARSRIIRDEQDRPVRWIGIDWDVTERKQADEELRQYRQQLEQRVEARTAALQQANQKLELEIAERIQIEAALRKSEERYRLLAENATDVIWTLDLDGRFTYVSPSVERLRGYTPEEVMQQPMSKALTPESLKIAESGLRKIYETIASGQRFTEQHRHELEQPCKDGSTVWTEVITSVMYDGEDDFVGILGVTRDISERRETEHALRRSEARYRALFEQANDAIFLNNLNDDISDVNRRACKLLGYSRQELLKMKIPDIQAPEVRKETGTAIKHELERHKATPFETIDLHRNGARIPVEVTSSEIAGQEEKLVLSIVRDIRERKQAEQALLRRNRELDLLNRIIAASVASQNQVTMLETVCHELAQAFELPQVAAALTNDDQIETVVVAEDRAEGQPSTLNQNIPLIDNPLSEYLAHHKAPLVIENVRTDPRLAPMRNLIHQYGIASIIILPLIVEDEVVGSISLNAVEPRQFSTEEVNLAWRVADQVSGALTRTRLSEKYRLLTAAIEQSSESIMIADKEDRIVYVNPTFERVTGYGVHEVLGQSPDILGSGKHPPAFFQELHETINSGQVWQGRITNRKKDGTLFTEEGTISPIRDQSGQIVNYVEVKRDVTQELERKKQYQQAQKMESIGRLTAGIAHDFNNLLTAINGFAELLQLRLPSDSPLQEMVTSIINSGQRAANLVRQLMAFSRKQVIDPVTIDLNAVVADMSKMMQRIIGEDIQLRTTLAPDLWLIKFDPAQIEQIIVNLAVNARDAMPAGGRLTIETANIALNESYSASHIETPPGQYVRLAVSDTGHGIKEAIKKYIFEPFFTTKETGKGTGLGLATVYGIVKQNGGDIQAYSEEGMGTTFKIYLPRATGPAAILAGLGEPQEIPVGDETILLVEDDQLARNLAQEVLQEQGYTLLEAKNGQEAVQLAAGYPHPIHLLLTDVVMPGMSGKTLAERLVQTRPHLRILFMSGYTDNAIAHHGVLDQGINFIQKPLSPTALAHEVRRVLDQ